MATPTVIRLEAEALDLPLSEPFAIASGAQHAVENVLVRVTLSDGTVGLGEAAPFTDVNGETRAQVLAAIDDCRQRVVGAAADDWRGVARTLVRHRVASAAARCGIEMALLDAHGRARGVPLWRLFGGAGRELVTDMTVTAGDREHAARSARAIHGRGIGTIKVKIGALGAAGDLERLGAIHAAVPAARLVVDANGGYDLAAAREFLAGVAGLRLPVELLEQPLPRSAWEDARTLRAESPIPIAADESATSSEDVLRIARDEVADAVNIKVMKSGVAEALSMVSVAVANDLELMIGGMVESILAMTFSAHLAAGIGNFRWIDLDTPFFIPEHPFAGGYRVEGERLILDEDAPGHGVTLDG